MKKMDFKKTMDRIWAFVKKKQVGIVAVICAIIVIGVFYWLFSWGVMGWPGVTGFEGKTIWDWLQLAIIPVVLAGGALLFNRSEKANEIKIAEKRNKSEQEIATDRQREEALQNYIDKMTELLIKDNLLSSKVKDEVRVVARTRTFTTLRLLDSDRKGILLNFLYEAGLINKNKCVIALEKANLAGANLTKIYLGSVSLNKANLLCAQLRETILVSANLKGAFMWGAHLEGAILGHARMENADLTGAHLEGAYLEGAYLEGAYLEGARLWAANLEGVQLEGAIMPDGKMYDPSIHNLDMFTHPKMEITSPTVV